MKIAITGHSAGIGKSFCEKFTALEHEVVGLSKRYGHNIRNIPKIADMIEPCDAWINNAQSGYAQTELLCEMFHRWQGQRHKMIWIISTVMARDEKMPVISGMTTAEIVSYRNQKRALEDAFYQLRTVGSGPRMMLIRPGSVATSAGKIADVDSADPDKWTGAVIDIFQLCRNSNLWPIEMSLSFDNHGPSL